MGEIRSTLFILLTITRASLLMNSVIAVNSSGFTLRMIHRDSKESPFSPVGDHLTQEERFERLVEQSKARAHYIGSQILRHSDNARRSMNPDAALVPVFYDATMWYVAWVGIGTFPERSQLYMDYYLIVDSASDLTWLQCEGTNKAFHQDLPLYPWDQSQTYHPIPCGDNFCSGNKCNDKGECIYEVTYANNATSSGVIAQETFTVTTSTGELERVHLARMGCGLHQENFDDLLGNNNKTGKPDLITGILGLGRGSLSFLNQLGVDGQGRFSYCFESYGNAIYAGSTFLSFGAEATIAGQVHSTPIGVPHFETPFYYLFLEDISVGGIKVGFAKEDFELKEDRRGGCIIDSGATMTTMYTEHFDRVALLVVAYFQHIGIPKAETTTRLCFVIPQVPFTTPSITFHFYQADYVVSELSSLFGQVGDNLCLGMFGFDGDHALVLGAMQQTNKRILYDNINMALSFSDEQCKLG